MNLLLDQGLPRSTVRHLALLGISSQHVGDLGMASATDAAILAYARSSQAVVVTLDADFHAILATTGATNPSVIRFRIEGLNGSELAQSLAAVIGAAAADLARGALVTVTHPLSIRIRLLPVV